jgi:hypothetical protein
MQQRPGVRHCQGRDGAGHVFGAERRSLKWIDRYVDLRPGFGTDSFSDEKHRSLVHLTLSDDHGAVDGQFVKLTPHGIDGRLVGGLILAVTTQAGRRDGRTLRHAHDFEAENAFQQ